MSEHIGRTRSRRQVLTYMIGGAGFGGLLTLLLWVPVDWFFTRTQPVSLEPTAVGLQFLLALMPMFLVWAIAAGLAFRGAIPIPVCVAMMLASSLTYGVAIAWGANNLFGLRTSDGPPGATAYLWEGLPPARDSDGEAALPLTRFTAVYLNLHKPPRALKGTVYLDGHLPSRRPFQLSVLPLSPFSWAAAARSDRDGRCHLLLMTVEPENNAYGSVRQAVMPRTAICTATMANSPDVHFADW